MASTILPPARFSRRCGNCSQTLPEVNSDGKVACQAHLTWVPAGKIGNCGHYEPRDLEIAKLPVRCLFSLEPGAENASSELIFLAKREPDELVAKPSPPGFKLDRDS